MPEIPDRQPRRTAGMAARLTAADPVVPPRFDAVILAGGQGTRLGGADKPGLAVGASTLAAISVAAAAAAGAQRVIAVGPPRPELLPLAARLPAGLVVVREDPPGSGPVPALRCGLGHVQQPCVTVLAADLPFLRGDHLRAMVPVIAGNRGGRPAGAVLVDDEGRPQWLIGCWRTGSLRSALRGYSGSSLRGLLMPLRPVMTSWDHCDGLPAPWLDCDTPADVSRARRWLAGAAPADPEDLADPIA